MINNFDDYEDKHINSYPIDRDDAEQIWDFLQEKSDLKMKLIFELDELLELPIAMHFEFSEEDQSEEANTFRNNLHRIKKIMETLKK